MSETKRSEIDYKNLQEPMLSYIKTKLEEYVASKEYVRLCQVERRKWEKDKEGYDPKKAPERVQGVCSTSLENCKHGVSAELCQGVENIPVDIAAKICKLAQTPGTTKMIPYAESLVRKYNIEPKQDQGQNPGP